MNEFGLTQEALGQAVGKSRSHIANTLRLLNLPDAVKQALRNGVITAAMRVPCWPIRCRTLACARSSSRELSVRQTEALASREPPGERTLADDLRRGHGPDAAALEHHLSEQLGLTVKVTFNGRRGMIQFHYDGLDQLDTLLRRFGLQQ